VLSAALSQHTPTRSRPHTHTQERPCGKQCMCYLCLYQASRITYEPLPAANRALPPVVRPSVCRVRRRWFYEIWAARRSLPLPSHSTRVRWPRSCAAPWRAHAHACTHIKSHRVRVLSRAAARTPTAHPPHTQLTCVLGWWSPGRKAGLPRHHSCAIYNKRTQTDRQTDNQHREMSAPAEHGYLWQRCRAV
jgi:hypothetical protein